MHIPFSPPYIDDDVISEVVDTLKSGWITTGPKTKQLEHAIAEFVKAPRVHCVNSATSGLMLALKWFGVGPGDEVIVPAYTYCATALAAIHLGAKPIMVDVNTSDFNINAESLKQAISEKTKAVIPVDIGGFPCDYDRIKSVIDNGEINAMFSGNNKVQKQLGRILIVADSAHAFGATYKGGMVGGIADMTVFSFHAVKNLTTAEGGAICINCNEFDNDALYNDLALMSLNGQTKSALSKSKEGNWRYDVVIPGFKANMPDLLASVALAQMRSYPELLVARQNIFKNYKRLFSHYEWAIIPKYDNYKATSSCHLFMLRIRDISEEQRDLIIYNVTKCGVSVNVHFVPLPLLSVFKESYDSDEYPQSVENYKAEISLPIYPQLTEEQVNYIVSNLVKAYNTVVNEEMEVG